MKSILPLYCLLITVLASAQNTGRVIANINDHWEFTKDNGMTPQAVWENINLPHTWNVTDVMDDEPGYYRGAGWYRKILRQDLQWKDKQLYVLFEGANQVTEVYVNGRKAGEHIGGYTAFCVPLSANWRPDGDNVLLVKVDNSEDLSIPPISADFSFYGGIYRSVSIIGVDPVHFSLEDFGSEAVFVSTPHVDGRRASLHVSGLAVNQGGSAKPVTIVTRVYDKRNRQLAIARRSLQIAANSQTQAQLDIQLNTPHLWSPDDPYLYWVSTSLVDEVSGRLLDEVSSRVGFRFFSIHPDSGFILNGKPLKLVGTSRHQDYPGLGNAVPVDLAIKDVELIKAMGGNFLRVAHYPQDHRVLDACDSLGILASVEIPIVNEIRETDSFYRHCEVMQVEMVRQNYNHPSVIMWCYMNEVLLRPQFGNDKERQKRYFSSIASLARRLDSLTRAEDPSRYTMMAYHGDLNRYRDAGLVDIPMVAGWNLYAGWYGPKIEDLPGFLDRFHALYPNKPMMVTEYGADADPRVRSAEPVRFDKSVEYATSYHRYYLKEINRRPFVAAAMIWNLADFNSETRTETMPHINNKGLMEWDRTPKDPYYYYKAMLQKERFVKILGPSIRGGVADSGLHSCLQLVQVAGNVAEIGINLNGQPYPVKRVDNGICEWRVPLVDGANYIVATGISNGKSFTDRFQVNCNIQPYQMYDTSLPFRKINVLLGAKRNFIDGEQECWIPDQAYRPGSWGHVGGSPFQLKNSNRLPYGTDKNIMGTGDDPVYQTQQTAIEKYRFDVPPGRYELTLHFAELLGGTVPGLDYNLDPSERIEPSGRRVFNVYLKDSLALDHFNILAEAGPAHALSKTFYLSVKDNKGIEIIFQPIEGDAVLNAVQLRRMDTITADDRNVSK